MQVHPLPAGPSDPSFPLKQLHLFPNPALEPYAFQWRTRPPKASSVPGTGPKRIENWSLTSLQQGLVKAGGRLVKHARYY